MKKICVVLLCAILCFSFLGLATGCDDKEEQDGPIDLLTCPIGTEIPFYPGNRFDFEVQYNNPVGSDNKETAIVHFESIRAVVYRRIDVAENEVITSDYHRFEIEVSVQGTAPISLANKKFEFTTTFGREPQLMGPIDIQSDGSFNEKWVEERDIRYIEDITFGGIFIILS